MSWSWRVGRIAGIDVYLHFTFLFLLAYMAFAHYSEHGSVAETLSGLGFILALFGIVVLHELGHALAARRYGIRTRSITLLPIGGVARLEHMPEDPRQELVVALAGPAVNVVLAGGIFIGILLGHGLSPKGDVLRIGGSFIDQLFWLNVTLALFNLLPAFPMDGGRVLRALLALRLDYVRATHVAASIGQGMAILFGLAGFFVFSNPFLVFIALFVWLGAAQEASMVQMRTVLAGIPVRRVMSTEFRVLRPEAQLAEAVDSIMSGYRQDFPVVEDDGRLAGLLTRHDLVAALGRHGPGVPVAEVMQREVVTADPCEMLQTAFSRLEAQACRTLPVVQNGRLLGIVTADGLAEVLMIQEALRESRGREVGRRREDAAVAGAVPQGRGEPSRPAV